MGAGRRRQRWDQTRWGGDTRRFVAAWSMTAHTRAAAALACLLLDALAARFGPVAREPRFEALRPKLAAAALVPSRVFDDSTAWTERGGDWRGVQFAGAVGRYGYRVGVCAAAPEPALPGDYRGRLQLRRIAGGRYEWQMDEELAVGAVRPADLAGALSALLQQAEQAAGSGPAARDAVLAAFPRTAAVLGRLCRIERLRLARDAEGSARVELAVRLTPDGLAPVAPRYAEFLRRYATPMKLHAVATDAGGAGWWEVDGARNAWTLRLRVRDGSLVPLAGPAGRGVPPALRVTADYETRMGLFTVGVRSLAAELTLTRTPVEKGFRARFVQEPGWQLPFLVAPLLHSSLRYPFEAEGSEASWAAREQPGGKAELVRSYRARVRESWLLRWLGGLTTGAVDEFRRGAEAEADLYARECLLALRDDLAALAAR